MPRSLRIRSTMLPSIVGICGLLFWAAMMLDCIYYERQNRSAWLGFMVLFNIFGAAFYAIMRLSPRLGGPTIHLPARQGVSRQAGARRLQRQPIDDEQVWKAEADARNIGKALQFVKLGHLRYDRGEFEQASQAYKRAMEQEPYNLQALWGTANLAIQQKELTQAQRILETLLAQSSDFQFGVGATLYGQVLLELGELDKAKAHLEAQAKVRRQPPDLLMRAKIHQAQGDLSEAQALAEDLILLIRSSPQFFQKEHRQTLREAERLLKGL